MQARKSVLFSRGSAWIKKGDESFDVTMGSWDGAEICELVGLYILSLLAHLDCNGGLYRDDGLIACNSTPRQVDNIKKSITKIFKDLGLKITIEANIKVVNFLDVTLNLNDNTFKTFNKPNNTPLYIHKQSNHPPTITKNLPGSINQRLSTNSSSEEMFNQTKHIFQDALKTSGYDHELKFTPDQPHNRSRTRKRNITWFNPPYSLNVTTSIAHKFLTLIDKHFPKGHPLHQIFNRNTVKVSYKTTANMKQIIAKQNKQIMEKELIKDTQDKTCNCRRPAECPLQGKCLLNNIIYQATIKETEADQTTHTETYIGLCSTTFKVRHSNHKKSFTHTTYKHETELSNHIWTLKDKGSQFEVKWRILDRANTYSPINHICNLCTKEKFYLICKPHLCTLNTRNELKSYCRHKRRLFL
jgi:hypothetical protein